MNPEQTDNLPPEIPASSAEILTCNDWIGAMRRLQERLETIGGWRAGCHEYDADMGNEPRTFDDEDWDLIEAEAGRCAAKLAELLEMAPIDLKLRDSGGTA